MFVSPIFESPLVAGSAAMFESPMFGSAVREIFVSQIHAEQFGDVLTTFFKFASLVVSVCNAVQ